MLGVRLKIKYFFVGLVLLLNFTNSFAQVRMTASAKGTVSVGEQFRLTYEVNAQGDNFKAPTIREFSVLSGPSQSSSSSISIVNGRTTQSVSIGFTYILQAVKEGKFTIPGATIRVDNKTVESNPVTIIVVKGAAANTNQQQAQQQNSQQNSNAQSGGNDIFIKVFVNKPSPYQGEDIIATYKLYTKVDIVQYSINKTPSNAGFWSQSLLKNNVQPTQTTEVINGEKYIVAEIYKLALTPQRSGKLKLDGLDLECIARVVSKRKASDDFFDNFFGGGFNTVQNVKKKVTSNPISINVKSLPEQSKPVNFTGAVGQYTLSSKIDRTSLKANEAITLRYTISGTGNLNLIEAPKLDFPSDFEVYDPKVIDNINTTASGNSGKRTYEYVMIPRTAGTFEIPAYSLSYFNPSTGTYKTLIAEKYEIKVAKGDGTAAAIVGGSNNQEDIKFLGNDIRYIKQNDVRFSEIGVLFYRSLLFWMLLIAPLFIVLAVAIIWRKELQKRSNVALMKNRKATRIAKKRLKNALKAMQENNTAIFFEEVSKAIWGYIADKMNIAISDLSIESIKGNLENKKIDIFLIDKNMELLKECEFARFAPGASANMNKTYTSAIAMIEELENSLK